ncbi:hypothetical protein N431DRAFT_462989 [Stipitochalara longipes BDJ]|nr:hypothetical protein N431DRAFT_462989 [Stipitochalara longipes BDJ]
MNTQFDHKKEAKRITFLETLKSYLYPNEKISESENPCFLAHYIDLLMPLKTPKKQLPEQWLNEKISTEYIPYGDALEALETNPIIPPSYQTKFGPNTKDLGKETNNNFVKKMIVHTGLAILVFLLEQPQCMALIVPEEPSTLQRCATKIRGHEFTLALHPHSLADLSLDRVTLGNWSSYIKGSASFYIPQEDTKKSDPT